MQIGDTVQLKSGGCDMTVLDVLVRHDYNTGQKYNEITCVWHDSNFVPYRQEYDSRALKRLDGGEQE